MLKCITFFLDECLSHFNEKRARHQNTSNLEWDCGLAKEAQKWANHLAEIGVMEHSKVYEEGECLYWMAGDTKPTSKDLIDWW